MKMANYGLYSAFSLMIFFTVFRFYNAYTKNPKSSEIILPAETYYHPIDIQTRLPERRPKLETNK